MRRVFIVTSIFFGLITLSGCSIVPASFMGGGKVKSVVPGGSGSNSPLERKTVIGSVWKSSDGGHSFESKSRLDREAITSMQDGSGSKEKSVGDSSQTKMENGAGDLISTANILSIAFHPRISKTIYVSTANDGLFMTNDGGELWKPIPFPPKNVFSFIVDSGDPDNTMYASGVVGSWGKIFRTRDAGKNWEEVYTEPGEKVPVTALAQNPLENNVIFAGTQKGTVAKSIDRGETWKNVGAVIDGNVSDITFDSKKKDSVYLLVYDKKLFYSNDAGTVWLDWEEEKKNEVASLYDRAASLAKSGKIKDATVMRERASDLSERNKNNKMPSNIVSISADPWISGRIYAGTKKGFFVSNDHGKYWYSLNIIESAKSFPIRSVAVNPKNSNEVVFVAGKAFYRSADEGKTWEIVGLDVDRDAAFVAYDPFESNSIFIGLRRFE